MQKQTEINNATAQQGLVISYFGNSVAVEDCHGQVFQCQLHRNQELPVVGDHVRWQMGAGNTGTVICIEPRRSLLTRGDGHGKRKAIAANIDVMVVVMAPPPIFSEYLVDRYLVAAELLHIAPIVVMNKIDLLDEGNREAACKRLEVYQHIPYPVAFASIYKDGGLQELASLLKDKTAVLVGPSGVGKSSIITALGSIEAIRVGDVSPKGSGKHTTTATRLYHLPQGGSLIDSPGVREFNLWPVTRADVLMGYKEFQSYLSGCRFRNCRHVAEPDCKVQEAVTDGKISQQRFLSYQELMKTCLR